MSDFYFLTNLETHNNIKETKTQPKKKEAVIYINNEKSTKATRQLLADLFAQKKVRIYGKAQNNKIYYYTY